MGPAKSWTINQIEPLSGDPSSGLDCTRNKGGKARSRKCRLPESFSTTRRWWIIYSGPGRTENMEISRQPRPSTSAFRVHLEACVRAPRIEIENTGASYMHRLSSPVLCCAVLCQDRAITAWFARARSAFEFERSGPGITEAPFRLREGKRRRDPSCVPFI